MYRHIESAPASRVAEDRRGAVVGRYCNSCHAIYPRLRQRHAGKPVYGRDHLATTCVHEGEEFAEGAAWWEPAVELLPAAEAPPAA